MDGPTEPVITFGIDALGRTRTRQVGTGTAETLHYLGTSDTVVRIGGGSTPVDGALDPAGTRLATRQSAGSPSFLVPDPHGNVAGLWSNTAAAVVDAFRYDPWGESLAASPASGARTPWRYQGRMVEGGPTDAESYDFGFRSYLADTGTFGSLDDVAGSAADVRSLNRFVYAQGDPVTLIDPDGHRVLEGDSPQEKMTTTVAKHQRKAVQQTARANKANGWTTYRRTTVSLAKPKPPMTLTKADAWADEVPTYTPEGTGGFDLGGFVHGGLDLLGFVPVVGAIPDLVNAGIYAAEGDLGMAALSATAAIPLVGDAVGVGKLALKYGDNVIGAVAHYGDEVVEVAASKADDVASAVGRFCSFSAATLVRTTAGQRPIGELQPGDEVLATEEASGTTAAYPISAVWSHPDALTGTVTIDGEPIATTPDHPFRTVDRGWVAAADLEPGDHVTSLTGSAGLVGSISWDRGPDTMWNLTVETAHTYTVGDGSWLVHNTCRGGRQVDPPTLDKTGKVHGPLPPYPPRSWNREALDETAQGLRQSIIRRQERLTELGEDASHRSRVNDEIRLLRQIEKTRSGS